MKFMPFAIAALLICGLVAACDQSPHPQDIDGLRQLYVRHEYKELRKQLSTMSVTDKAFVLPVSAGYLLNNFEQRSSGSVLTEIEVLVNSSVADPSVKSDPFAMRVAKTYEFIAKELDDRSVDWSAVCDAPASKNNSCACRQELLQQQLPKIDVVDAAPELDRSLWIAESGASHCQSYDYPFQIFATVISMEHASEFDYSDLTNVIAIASHRNASKTNFLLCALRRHYLDYSNSKLRLAEEQGLFSCPTAVVD